MLAKHIENEKISIRGSDFDDDEFILTNFHLHWGYHDYHGSEHLIGKRLRYFQFVN